MKQTDRPTFEYEKRVWDQGYPYVIGVDEVGRGAFAGPVTVGATVFTKDILTCNAATQEIIDAINDSKLLSAKKREILFDKIHQCAFLAAHETVSVNIINTVGIGKATQLAFRRIIKNLLTRIEFSSAFLLIDGFHIKYIRGIGLKNQQAIIKGDRKSISIAAASIIAKVHRDSLMKQLASKYTNYDFATNKGYGTKKHRDMIKKYGLSPIHRTSFSIVV
jgi:ribonuclease HII